MAKARIFRDLKQDGQRKRGKPHEQPGDARA